MARADSINLLYSQRRQQTQFNFDLLMGPPVTSLLSPYDIQLIWEINNDPRLNTKLKERLSMIDNIMKARGFARMTQGTNRACYKYYEDQSFIFKVAISKPGWKDSSREFYNQNLLKPFVTKCFDVNGIIGSFERVDDITSQEQFMSIGNDVFTLLNDHILGQYVMADIGTKYFRNYGIRIGFGPVILDYPMLFEVDGDKLFCNNKDSYTGEICGGQIDYDAGFNHLYCEKCGKMYLANELQKKITSQDIIRRSIENPMGSGRRIKMKIRVFEGDKEVIISQNVMSSNVYKKKANGNKPQPDVVIKKDDVTVAKAEVDSVEDTEENLTEVEKEINEIREDIDKENAPVEQEVAEPVNIEEDDPADSIEPSEEEFKWVDVPFEICTLYASDQLETAAQFMTTINGNLKDDPNANVSTLLDMHATCLENSKRAISTHQIPEEDVEEYTRRSNMPEDATPIAGETFSSADVQSPEELKVVIQKKVTDEGMENY